MIGPICNLVDLGVIQDLVVDQKFGVVRPQDLAGDGKWKILDKKIEAVALDGEHSLIAEMGTESKLKGRKECKVLTLVGKFQPFLILELTKLQKMALEL